MSTAASVTIAPITLADVPGFHACLDAVAREQRHLAQVLQACLDQARLCGLTRIELESRIDNHRAIARYERLGFRREVLKVRAMRFGDRYFDTVQMSRLFD